MAAPLRSRLIHEVPTAEGFAGRSVADLVADAARRDPGATAYTDGGVHLTYRSLVATASATRSPLDDSGLTVALMMNVPGLAASGASGLASTLARVRTRAVGTLCSSATHRTPSQRM